MRPTYFIVAHQGPRDRFAVSASHSPPSLPGESCLTRGQTRRGVSYRRAGRRPSPSGSGTKGVVTTPDPRKPLVIDIRDLGRRAGSMLELHRVVPAPADLGVGLARVPEGTDITLDLRMESVVEGVLVTATATAEVVCECARCLDRLSYDEEVRLVEMFRYPATNARGVQVAEDENELREEPPAMVIDDMIDLEAPLRDALVLDLPISPLCAPDCAGLCPTCGIRLAGAPDHHHDSLDPRWAALAALTETLGVTDADIATDAAPSEKKDL